MKFSLVSDDHRQASLSDAVVLPVPGGPHRMIAIKERLPGEQPVGFDGAAL